MPLCTCNDNENHKHRLLMKWEYCPLEKEKHTSFIIFFCFNCNGISAFPNDNFELALEEGTKKTKKILKAIVDE